jgi:hypothetical protein
MSRTQPTPPPADGATPPDSAAPARASARRLRQLAGDLTPADLDVLGLLGQHRCLATRHLAGLVHADASTPLASTRAAQRQLRRLAGLGLAAPLDRRIGGLGGGAAQTIWRLTEAGHRLLRLTQPDDDRPGDPTGQTPPTPQRVRFREPSPQFLSHTLHLADIRLVLEQLSQKSDGRATTDLIQTEPDCWRDWLGPHGTAMTLRPDLYAEISVNEPTQSDSQSETDGWLDCWFIEADLATEHLPTIARKARVYAAYRRSGREQASGGVFPLVLWVTPDQRRAQAILAAITADPACDPRLHHATTIDNLSNHLLKGGQYE